MSITMQPTLNALKSKLAPIREIEQLKRVAPDATLVGAEIGPTLVTLRLGIEVERLLGLTEALREKVRLIYALKVSNFEAFQLSSGKGFADELIVEQLSGRWTPWLKRRGLTASKGKLLLIKDLEVLFVLGRRTKISIELERSPHGVAFQFDGLNKVAYWTNGKLVPFKARSIREL